VHKVPTLKPLIFLARPWEIINLRGLLSHNIDIFSSIDGIMSNFDLPNVIVSSSFIRIEPMAFEYHWFKLFRALKVELVYFFNYAIIVEIIVAGRTNSCARGLSGGPTLLVASRAKAIAIHIINDECFHPRSEAPCNLFQFITHFPICACLQGEAR
jgi:hypothetical protein